MDSFSAVKWSSLIPITLKGSWLGGLFDLLTIGTVEVIGHVIHRSTRSFRFHSFNFDSFTWNEI